MDHPNNILNNIKSIFAWKRIRYSLADVLLIVRERLVYQKSLSKFKKLSADSESTAKDFSPSHRGPVANLELRKNHTFENNQLKVVNAVVEILKGNNHGNTTEP